MKEKLLNKIKKLLALGSSPNENEAHAATQKAYRLLAEHNIDMQEIQTVETEYNITTINEYVGVRRSHFLFTCLSIILKKHFFVETFYNKAPIKNSEKKQYNIKLNLYGLSHNIEVAKYTYFYLSETYIKLYKEAKKRYKNISRNDYYKGLTDAIDEKLEIKKLELQEERGLILLKDKELEKFNKKTGRTKSQRKLSYDSIGYCEGLADGKEVDLYKAINY